MQKKLQLSLLLTALFSQLDAQELTLDTFTVTAAAKTEQNIKDVTADTQVITAEEIEERRFTTITEALNSLSGINFSNNGGLGKTTSLYLRGFDSKRVLVLIDGVRMNDITSISGAPFSHFMISDIERIEMIKGAQSGVWGADASAGVINIITKSAQEGFHAGANTEFGRYNTKKFGANISYADELFYIKAASQLVESDGFSVKVPSGEDRHKFENDPYKNITTDLKAGVTITPTNKIDMSYRKINATNDYDPYITNPDYSVNETASANGYAQDITHDSFSQITYDHIDSFNQFKLYAKQSVFDREFKTDTSVSEFNGKVNEYGASSKIPYRSKDFTLITLDYKKFIQNDTVDQSFTNKAGAFTNSNVFTLGKEELIVTEALRYDQYNKFDNTTTGKFGLRYNSNLLKSFSLLANFGSAYNVPTLYQLYSRYGSTALAPEDTKSYDLTLEYNGFKASYFYNTIEDMIDFDMTTYKYNNIDGKSTIQGFEIGYNNYITNDLLLDVSYTSLDAKDKDDKTLARRPKATLKYALTYYATQNLDFTVDGEYVGERYDAADDQGAQTGKYNLVNFAANFKVNKGLTTYIKVDNLFNKEYQVVDGYTTAERSFFVGLNFKIK